MKKIVLLIYLTGTILSNIMAQLKTVQTREGKIAGTVNGVVASFKGVPFATPPIGPLRWKAPLPPAPRKGTLDCRTFSASPMQSKPVPFMCWTEEFIAPPEPLSEDCLYLNVWTAAKKPGEKRPVFVWIYGGGFGSGSAACAIYDGEEYARRGVVFVSINYRVGVFGFLAHPELSKESGVNASGNYGIMDQVAALQWIRDNIASFGGDPENVTIAGQSAGSMSVNALVASPLAKGLFHKAIAQSGGLLGGRFVSDKVIAEKNGLDFQQKIKAGSLAAMRALSADSLQRAAEQAGGMRFGLILDTYVLPADIYAAFEKGQFNDVPVMTGWVPGDGALFGNNKTTKEAHLIAAQSRYKDEQKRARYLTLFPGQTDEEATRSTELNNLLNFAGLTAYNWARFSKNPVYLYEFNRVPPAKENFPDFGSFHTADVPYALHTLHKWNRNWTQKDRSIELQMSMAWIQFVKTGSPNKTAFTEWKPYDKKEASVMVFGDEVKTVSGLYRAQLEFLSGQ